MNAAIIAVVALAANNVVALTDTLDRKAGVPKPGPVQPFTIPSPTEFTLKNHVRVVFFERRKERRQVQSVLEAEQDRLRTEQERRMQRELDDWFGMKQIRRGIVRREPPS